MTSSTILNTPFLTSTPRGLFPGIGQTGDSITHFQNYELIRYSFIQSTYSTPFRIIDCWYFRSSSHRNVISLEIDHAHGAINSSISVPGNGDPARSSRPSGSRGQFSGRGRSGDKIIRSFHNRSLIMSQGVQHTRPCLPGQQLVPPHHDR